jgi:hypothetical protein
METCSIETGLLRKKPCGHAAVTKCANCETPLCAQHAVAQMSAAQKKTGAFMCKECDDAQKQFDKNQAKHEKDKRDGEMMKSLANPAPPKPKGAAPGPASAPQGKDSKPPAASEPVPDTIEYRPEPKKK